MRRLQKSWAILLLIGAVCSLLSEIFIVLTMTQGAVEAGMNLPNILKAPQVLGARMEHLVSGIDGIQENAMNGRSVLDKAQSSGLDAGALLNGIAQGQEGAQSRDDRAKTGHIGSEIANQIVGGGSPGINQILEGLAEQNQVGAKNQSTLPAQDQVKEKAPPRGEDEANSQIGSGKGLPIQIEQTTVTEANGQQIKTEIVKEVGTSSAAATVQTPPERSLAEVQSTPLPSSMAELLTKGEPAPTPVAIAESLAQAKNSTTAAEAVKSTPNAHPAQSLAETSKVMVCTDIVLLLVGS
jgi:hypothetical protein